MQGKPHYAIAGDWLTSRRWQWQEPPRGDPSCASDMRLVLKGRAGRPICAAVGFKVRVSKEETPEGGWGRS